MNLRFKSTNKLNEAAPAQKLTKHTDYPDVTEGKVFRIKSGSNTMAISFANKYVKDNPVYPFYTRFVSPLNSKAGTQLSFLKYQDARDWLVKNNYEINKTRVYISQSEVTVIRIDVDGDIPCYVEQYVVKYTDRERPAAVVDVIKERLSKTPQSNPFTSEITAFLQREKDSKSNFIEACSKVLGVEIPKDAKKYVEVDIPIEKLIYDKKCRDNMCKKTMPTSVTMPLSTPGDISHIKSVIEIGKTKIRLNFNELPDLTPFKFNANEVISSDIKNIIKDHSLDAFTYISQGVEAGITNSTIAESDKILKRSHRWDSKKIIRIQAPIAKSKIGPYNQTGYDKVFQMDIYEDATYKANIQGLVFKTDLCINAHIDLKTGETVDTYVKALIKQIDMYNENISYLVKLKDEIEKSLHKELNNINTVVVDSLYDYISVDELEVVN